MTPDLPTLKREARKKGTPATRLLELAALDPQLSRTVAKSKHTPANVLEQLAKSSDVHTRKAVAANPAVPLALMEKLARDNQWTVLKGLAQNPSTPDHLLVLLAQHKRDTVRHALFQRYFAPLPDEVLETFARSPHVEDRRLLAYYYGHPLPPHLVQQLECDPDTRVRLNLVQSQGRKLSAELLQECLQSHDPALRWIGARITTSPETLTDLLLNDPDIGVKCSAAGNQHTPESALITVAEHLVVNPGQGKDFVALVTSLLYNPHTPKDLKTKLRKHQNLPRPLKNLVDAEEAMKGATP